MEDKCLKTKCFACFLVLNVHIQWSILIDVIYKVKYFLSMHCTWFITVTYVMLEQSRNYNDDFIVCYKYVISGKHRMIQSSLVLTYYLILLLYLHYYLFYFNFIFVVCHVQLPSTPPCFCLANRCHCCALVLVSTKAVFNPLLSVSCYGSHLSLMCSSLRVFIYTSLSCVPQPWHWCSP